MAVVCSSQIPAGHQLALVTLRGVQGIVVRDVTDLTHPVTRCGFSGGSNFRFVSSTRVSYIVTTGSLGSPGGLYLVDLTTSTTSLVRAWSSGGYASWVYAWSPDGQKLSYLGSDASGLKWHVLSAAGDKTLSDDTSESRFQQEAFDTEVEQRINYNDAWMEIYGVPVAYMTLEGEGHGFRKADSIVRTLEAELYFYLRIFGLAAPDAPAPVAIDNLPAPE